MLEGLEISEVVYSWILSNNFDLRIDSEYFLKKYTHIDSVLSKVATKCTKEISSKITDGTHYTPDYQDTGYKFFSAINVSDNYFDADAGFKYISEKEHKQLYSRCNPMENDVLLRKVGVGDRKACVVPEMDEQFSIFVSVALIKCKLINPYYLSTFINSKYGQSQLLRFNKGIGQPDLHLEDIARCQIPMLNETFQTKIEQLVKVAHKIILQSKKKYAKAENLLIKELSLDSWPPSKEATTIRKFSYTQSSNRWDAEYYQPKYEACKKIIESYEGGYDIISYICNVLDANYLPKNGVSYKYIELANIGKNGEITGYTQCVGEDLPSRARRIVRVGDIIVSSVEGSLQSCAIIPTELDGALCSTGFYVIRSSIFIPEALLVLFKSQPIQMLMKKGCSGTILTAIGKTEFEKIPLPLVNTTIQQEISQQVQESFKLRSESKRLLEVAKRTVEIAIEEDEEKAIQYINKYGKSLYDK